MAELLIKAIDAIVEDDPVKDKAGSYKRGDVVVIYPDGHEYGKIEGLPKFMIVKIPDLSFKDAQKYIEEEVDDTDLNNIITITRRRYKFLVDDIPSEIGEVVMTKEELNDFIEEKPVTVIIG